MRLVCPECKNDDRLYSVESADLMYPITATTDNKRVTYEGGEYVVLDEGTHFEGRIYCRCEGVELERGQLLMAATCTECGEAVYRKQNTVDQIMTGGGLDSWRDSAGIPLCQGQATLHNVAA